jgi:hypothetical protein
MKDYLYQIFRTASKTLEEKAKAKLTILYAKFKKSHGLTPMIKNLEELNKDIKDLETEREALVKKIEKHIDTIVPDKKGAPIGISSTECLWRECYAVDKCYHDNFATTKEFQNLIALSELKHSYEMRYQRAGTPKDKKLVIDELESLDRKSIGVDVPPTAVTAKYAIVG